MTSSLHRLYAVSTPLHLNRLMLRPHSMCLNAKHHSRPLARPSPILADPLRHRTMAGCPAIAPGQRRGVPRCRAAQRSVAFWACTLIGHPHICTADKISTRHFVPVGRGLERLKHAFSSLESQTENSAYFETSGVRLPPKRSCLQDKGGQCMWWSVRRGILLAHPNSTFNGAGRVSDDHQQESKYVEAGNTTFSTAVSEDHGFNRGCDRDGADVYSEFGSGSRRRCGS